MKHLKTYESVKDYLKPKSEEEIKDKLDSLPLPQRINTIIRYKLYTEEQIKDMINSLPISDLKDLLKSNSVINRYISNDTMQKIYPTITQIYDMIKNSPFWKMKGLRDYQASLFVQDSKLEKITYLSDQAFFIINLMTKIKFTTQIVISENLSDKYWVVFKDKITSNDRESFSTIEEFFKILSTHPKFPEPLRKYFTYESTLLPSNIERMEKWISDRRKLLSKKVSDEELDELDESIRDHLKPKSEKDIKKSIENFSAIEKIRNGCEYDILWLVKQGMEEVDINTDNILNTYLKFTSIHGHLDIIKYLVEKGADIHYQDEYCLKISVEFGYLNIVKFLVEKGADIHINNEEPLRYALDSRQFDVAKYLIEQGADIEKVRKISKELEDWNLIARIDKITSTKTYESVRDQLKPKSEEDIKKSLEGLPKIRKIYKLLICDIDWCQEMLKNEIGDYLEIDRNQYDDFTMKFAWNHISNVVGIINNGIFKHGHFAKSDTDYVLSVYIGSTNRKEWDIKKIGNLYILKKIHTYFDGGGYNTMTKGYYIVYNTEKLIDLINNYKDVNESVKDFLKPKSEEEILNSLKTMSKKNKNKLMYGFIRNDDLNMMYFMLNNGVEVNNDMIHIASRYGSLAAISLLRHMREKMKNEK